MSGRIRVPWPASLLLAVATGVSLLAYSDPVELGSWLLGPLTLLAGIMLVVVVTRVVTRSRLLPTALGLLVALAGAVPLHTDYAFPTPAAARALVDAVGEGVTYAATSVAPVEDARPLAPLVTVALVLLFLVTEHISVSWRATGIAGAFLLLPWLPAAIVPWSVPWQAAAAALAAWLGALALTSMHEDVPLPPRLAAWVPAVAATIVVAAMLTPLAVGAPGWGRLPQAQIGGDAATRLDLDLDLRESLNSRSNSVVLTYTSTSGSADVLRLYTAEDFNGSEWDRGEQEDQGAPVSSGVLWPEPGLLDGEPGTSLEISIETLQQDALPVTVDPRRVYASDDWFYDSVRDEVRSAATDTEGLAYTVVTDPGYITADRLQAAPPLQGEQAQALDLADPIDVDRIGAIARDLVDEAGATTEYEQALAIQRWLRDPAEFTYDTTVALQGRDAVSEFLDTRQGYCVQFATTMVVMARTLDIPARMGVGFLGGEAIAPGEYEVIGGNAHAWPELYFPGTGWVRFEPTPAIQASAPEYAEGADAGETPTPSPSPTTSNEPAPTSSAEPSASASPSPSASAGAEPGDESATDVPTALPWVAIALLLAAGAAAWVITRRRGAAREAARGVESAWSRLRSRLPEAARWPLSATPYEAARHIRDQVSLSPEADAALDELTESVTSMRYAPRSDAEELPQDEVERLKGLADEVVAGARATGTA